MNKILCLLFLLGGLPSLAFSYGRSGDLADPTFLNSGDRAYGISVTMSSESATQVYYTTTTTVIDREILLQIPDDT